MLTKDIRTTVFSTLVKNIELIPRCTKNIAICSESVNSDTQSALPHFHITNVSLPEGEESLLTISTLCSLTPVREVNSFASLLELNHDSNRKELPPTSMGLGAVAEQPMYTTSVLL